MWYSTNENGNNGLHAKNWRFWKCQTGLIIRRLRNCSWWTIRCLLRKWIQEYQERWAGEAILEIPFHVIFGERGRLGVTRNATRSNAYANRQTCFGQKRLLAWVATMSRCHQRNICACHNRIISIRNSRASRHNRKPRWLAKNVRSSEN